MKKFYFLLIIFVSSYNVNFGVDWYWVDGSTDGNWGTALNWFDGIDRYEVPAIGDNVIFDFDATGCNTSCTINVTTYNSVGNRLGSITMQGSYTGSVIQSNLLYILDLTISSGTFTQSNTLHVGDESNGDGTFTVSGGTFSGGSSAINFNGSFTFSSGSFTSTSGTARVIRDFTYSGGSWSNNSGTFQFQTYSTTTTTQTITGSLSFYNLQIVTKASVTADYVTVVANTITVTNTFTMGTNLGSQNRALSINTGTININNTFTLSGSSTSTNGGGTATLNFNRSDGGTQTITGSPTEGRRKLPNIKISQSGGSSLILTDANYISVCGNWDFVSGTLTPGTSTVVFCGTMAQTIKGAQNSAFYNLKKNTAQILTIGDPTTAGTTVSATNSFTWTDNNDKITVGNGQNVTFSVPGALTINSGCTLESTANGTVSLAGTWTNDGTFTPSTGTVTIGAASASITGTGTNTFNNLTLNYSGGDGKSKVTIPSQKAVTVSGTLTLNTNDTLFVDGSASGFNSYSGSLITSGTITNSGGFCNFKTALTKLDPSGTRWHCVSSPISDATLQTVYASSLPNRFSYDETSASSYWVAASGAMTVGKGYFVAYSANKFQYFRSAGGSFNTGDKSIAITNTPAGRNGWNEVGNPFPAAIDIKATGFDSDFTTMGNNTIYIKNGANWATFNRSTDAATYGGTRYIQPCQGFFVVTTTSITFDIPAAARVHNTGATLLKSTSPFPKINLTCSDGTLSSENIIMFVSDATSEFDQAYDAHKLFSDNSLTPELYTCTSGNDTMVVDVLPEFSTELVRPLGLKTTAPGTYTISAREIVNFDPSVVVFLEDVTLGIFTNLNIDSSYTFTVTEASFNSTSRFNLKFSFSTPPQIIVQPASVVKCEGESVIINVTPNNALNLSYQWYNAEGAISGANSDSLIFNNLTPVDANDYYCIITNQYGTVQSAPATLTVNSTALISQSPVSSVNCEGEITTLSVVASGTDLLYQWQKDGQDIINEVGASLQFSQLSTSDNGNYTCIVTNLCNTLTSDVASLTVNNFPVVNLGSNQTVCEGTTVTLDAGNTGATYLWNDLSTNQIINPSTSGTYSVAVTKDGCTSNASVDITMIPNPVVNLGNDISVCAGTLVTLNAGNNGTSYLWNDNSTNQQFITSVSGTYSVAVTKDGCTSSDEIIVTVNSFPVVNLGNNQTVCEGTPVVLDAGNPGLTYLWSNGSTAQQLNVTTGDIYEVTVTNNGCSSSDYVFINFKPTPVVDLGSDISSCGDETVTLDAGYITGNTYTWSNGSHNEFLSPAVSGVYSVTVTNNGCTGTDEINVAITANPVVNLGNDQIVCEGTMVTLDAGNIGTTYLWNDLSTNQSINPATSGTYSVTVTENACSGTDAVTITFKPAPVVDLGSDISVCDGQVVNLDAGYVTGNSYIWSNGSHNEIISTVISGLYAVTVTNNGCTGTDQINVTVNSNPIVDLGSDISICSGCTETLDAGNSGAAYLWSTGETTQTIDVTVTGTYSVTVTSAEGCSDIDEIIVDVVSGIETNSVIDKIELYPNPAANYITISANLKGVYNIDVTDITGKIILSLQTVKNKNELNISNLEKGAYLIRISNSENQFIKTFIKN